MFRSGLRKMVLLKYFKRIKPCREERIQGVLPKPDGPLAHLMPSSRIRDSSLYNHLLLNTRTQVPLPPFILKRSVCY